MDSVNIAGISIPLRLLSRDELKGLPVIYSFSYRFYDFSFRGSQMILLESVKEHSTPTACRKAADRIEERFGRPVVFYFDNLLYYQRKRLVEHGVYYISGERDVFLPMLIASQVKKKILSGKLSAAAQYLLMYHLQVESLEKRPIQELAKVLPYSYISIAKAVQNLEDLGLCRSKRDTSGNKSIDFGLSGKELWVNAKPFMASPVKERHYCTGLPEERFPSSGISALSMYSHLAPDSEQTIAVYAKEWKKEQFENLNSLEGPYIVEFWRYPAIGNKSVDKLSLYLSMENDPDPRVHKELEYLFESVWKKS